MRRTVTTTSGATLVIGVASFKDCLHLKNVIEKELSKVNIDISKLNLESTDISAVLNPIIAVDSSAEFIDAFFRVAVKSSYNDEKVTLDIFEDEKAREDYYDVLINVLKENIAPFFKGLVLSLKQNFAKIKKPDIQK